MSGLGSTELHSGWIEQTTYWLQELLSCFILQLNKAQRGLGGGAETTPPLNTTRLRLFKLVPSCLLSFTYLLTALLGGCESMPSAAPSPRRYYVVVTEMWTAAAVRGSRRCQNPFRLSSGSSNGVLFPF